MNLATMRRIAICACTAALLGACGSDGSNNGAANTTPATATTSTAAPQATTTLATAPSTGSATSAPSTAATAAITTPVSAASTTAATVATTTATTVVAAQYSEVSPPTVPSTSAAVQADNSHPDGIYYATVTEGGDPPPANGAVVFELVQLFVGDGCIAHFGADDPDSCVNDYGVETNPTGTIEVALDRQFVSVADAATQKSYRINGTELYALIHGDDPAIGAPADYVYVGFGYFLTISGGKVTRLEQWWTP